MRTVNMHDAKTNLSRLVERAAKGEPFIIAKAGRPVVRVVAISDAERSEPRRLGFLSGQFQIPDDFDRLGNTEIENLFGLEA